MVRERTPRGAFAADRRMSLCPANDSRAAHAAAASPGAAQRERFRREFLIVSTCGGLGHPPASRHRAFPTRACLRMGRMVAFIKVVLWAFC